MQFKKKYFYGECSLNYKEHDNNNKKIDSTEEYFYFMAEVLSVRYLLALKIEGIFLSSFIVS